MHYALWTMDYELDPNDNPPQNPRCLWSAYSLPARVFNGQVQLALRVLHARADDFSAQRATAERRRIYYGVTSSQRVRV